MEFLTMAFHGFAYGTGGVVAYYVVSGIVAVISSRPRPVA